MTDDCATCGHPKRWHTSKNEWADTRRFLPARALHCNQIDCRCPKYQETDE